MRVYVLAKELGLSSKELLAFFHKLNISASSHMAMLSKQDCEKARKAFSKTPSVKSNSVSKPKDDKVAKPLNKRKEVLPLEQSPAIHKKIQIVPPQDEQAYHEEQPQEIKKVRTVTKEEEDAIREVVEGAVSEGGKLLGLKGEEKFARRFSIIKPKRKSSRRRRRRSLGLAKEAEKIEITEFIIDKERPLFEVAELMGKQSSELIGALLKKGKVCSKNQVLAVDVIKELANAFELAFTVAVKPSSNALSVSKNITPGGATRGPVVVIMGHVDHGKTSLLDYILKTNVAAREKGGITQHISVYQINRPQGKIVFLDTPGHEAFSYLRKRGAKVTDLVVLVVAADDGVMPQTVEAIKHAREAEVPIIVAINKIDKVGAATGLETIKRQLAQHNLMAEDWGGDIICVPVSAKTGQGVDDLLGMITLQAQMMELKGHPESPGKAFVIESRLDKGYGPVVNAICTEGTIRIGDHFVCGENTGKVRLLIDPFGNKLKEAGPATPVNIVGFNSSNAMGDWLSVVSSEEYLKARAGKRDDKTSGTDFMQQQDPFAEKKNQITLLIKADTRGSLEAITDSLHKLTKAKKDVGCSIVIANQGIGDITETDIDFAMGIGALILGFNVKVERNAVNVAKEKSVNIEIFNIIYKLIEHLEKAIDARKVVKKVSKKVGEAVVRKVFDIKGIGVIAGCYLREGICSRTNKVACIRGGKKIGEGKITSLQRDRKSVKEIHTGFEFGFSSDAFQEWQEDDIVHFFAEVDAE